MKKSVYMLFAVLILCLVCACGAKDDGDLFSGQKALSQQDIDYFCSWREILDEYSSNVIDSETYDAKCDALFKKAGWDETRREYVWNKVIFITQIIMAQPTDEELKQYSGPYKSLIPTTKEIDLVKKDKDRIGKLLMVPL